MGEKEYIVIYSENARKRHYHKVEKGKIIHFVVQLEVKVKDEWKPVIRFDCSHQYAHCDKYNLTGKQKKYEMNLSYKEALTFGDRDIKRNWRLYRDKFLKGEYP